MNQRLRILLSVIVLTSLIFSCSDHRLEGPSPTKKLRLKVLETVNVGTTQFNYDGSNRVSSFIDPSKNTSLISYDDQNRFARVDVLPDPNNVNKGTRYRFSYSTTSNNFTVYESILGLNSPEFNGRYFILNEQKQLTNYYTGNGGDNKTENYTYTGNNITTSVYGESRRYRTENYEYDDKINPFYGTLFGTREQQFSKNNIVKSVSKSDGGYVDVYEYIYTYNEQGLPTSMREKNGKELYLFQYESY